MGPNMRLWFPKYYDLVSLDWFDGLKNSIGFMYPYASRNEVEKADDFILLLNKNYYIKILFQTSE